MSGPGAHYVFRELLGVDELRELMAMRFRIYCETPGHGNHDSIDPNSGLDAEVFDLYARHFGLFVRGEEDERLVGGVRVVGPEISAAAGAVLELTRRHPSLRTRVIRERPAPLPAASYLEDGAAVRDLVARVVARGERIVEPGRLVLDRGHRAAATTSTRHAARHLMDAAVAHCLSGGVGVALLTCTPAHVPFYRPYGFSETAGTQSRLQAHLGYELTCLDAEARSLPARARERCLAIAERLGRFGEACTCMASAEPCTAVSPAIACRSRRFAWPAVASVPALKPLAHCPA